MIAPPLALVAETLAICADGDYRFRCSRLVDQVFCRTVAFSLRCRCCA